jgi:hypothetical protein
MIPRGRLYLDERLRCGRSVCLGSSILVAPFVHAGWLLLGAGKTHAAMLDSRRIEMDAMCASPARGRSRLFSGSNLRRVLGTVRTQ